jgi:hypothetical protein
VKGTLEDGRVLADLPCSLAGTHRATHDETGAQGNTLQGEHLQVHPLRNITNYKQWFACADFCKLALG